MWYKGKQIASKMNGVQFQRTDKLRSFWVHSKVGIAFTLAHMLNTRFKEYYISNICEIMAFQPAKTEKYSQIPKMETYDSLTFIMNIHSVIHLSSIHPSINIYWALMFAKYCHVQLPRVILKFYVSTWLGHRVPRYLVKHDFGAGISLVVQWLRFLDPNARGPGSNLDPWSGS